MWLSEKFVALRQDDDLLRPNAIRHMVELGLKVEK
jgi:hypothetical protein